MPRTIFKPLAVVAAAVLMLVTLPSTAQAATQTGCNIYYPDWNCSTGTIPANSRGHYINMFTGAYSADKATCIVWDVSNWVEVGRIVDTRGGTWKTIHGLYGRYTMGCYTNYRDGSAEGYINNI